MHKLTDLQSMNGKLLKKQFSWVQTLWGMGVFGFLIFGLVSFYIFRDRSFDVLPYLSQRSTPNNWASSVKIGIIGDSWVAGNVMNQAIQRVMLINGIPVEIVSSRHPGANSRQILRDLLSEDSQPYSSHKLLMDEDIDYLIVVAGVNDTGSHVGSDFYAHHVLRIIRLAQLRGIYPIVVEVPEYGIAYLPYTKFLSFAKHTIYRSLFDGWKHDVISDYRKALRRLIPPSMKDSMTLVSFDPFIPDYSSQKHLYANPSHLNKKGFQQLGSFLAHNIVKTHNKRIQRDGLKAAPDSIGKSGHIRTPIPESFGHFRGVGRNNI